MNMYHVTKTCGDEWYILAEDLEEAAWKASHLAGGVNYLKDITLHEPNYLDAKETRVPKQLEEV